MRDSGRRLILVLVALFATFLGGIPFSSAQIPPDQLPREFSGNTNFCPIDWKSLQFGGLKEACSPRLVNQNAEVYCCPVLKAWVLAGLAEYIKTGNPMPVADNMEQGNQCLVDLQAVLTEKGIALDYPPCGLTSQFFTKFSCGAIVSIGDVFKYISPSGLTNFITSCQDPTATGCASCRTVLAAMADVFGRQILPPGSNATMDADDCWLLSGAFLLTRDIATISTATSIYRSCPLNSGILPLANAVSSLQPSPAPGPSTTRSNAPTPTPNPSPTPAPSPVASPTPPPSPLSSPESSPRATPTPSPEAHAPSLSTPSPSPTTSGPVSGPLPLVGPSLAPRRPPPSTPSPPSISSVKATPPAPLVVASGAMHRWARRINAPWMVMFATAALFWQVESRSR